MVIIETPIFTKLIKRFVSDDEYQNLQEALILKPDLGAIIKTSGGLRKLRWSSVNRGKRSGIRVIYYWLPDDHQVYMLFAYIKNEQENLTDVQLSTLRKIVQGWGK
jgi:hypothetical protein